MTEPLIAAAAAACRECADYYSEHAEENNADFIKAWKSLRAGYEGLVEQCPPCDPDDPGDPPPA